MTTVASEVHTSAYNYALIPTHVYAFQLDKPTVVWYNDHGGKDD